MSKPSGVLATFGVPREIWKIDPRNRLERLANPWKQRWSIYTLWSRKNRFANEKCKLLVAGRPKPSRRSSNLITGARTVGIMYVYNLTVPCGRRVLCTVCRRRPLSFHGRRQHTDSAPETRVPHKEYGLPDGLQFHEAERKDGTAPKLHTMPAWDFSATCPNNPH